MFCLLLGPTFVRSLNRFRRRFELRWAPVAAGLLALAALAGVAASPPTSEAASAKARAVAYLERAQNADGGFGGSPSSSSTQLHTGWAALGLAAAGVNPADVQRGGHSILDYMRAHAGQLKDTGDIERTILTLGAIGSSPRSFAGRDLVTALKRRRSRNGSWKGNTTWTSFGILALRSSGKSSVKRSARWLARQQNRDGGFGFRPHAASSTDDTGAAVQALGVAGKRRSKVVRRAVGFLRRSQNRDGGFGLLRGQLSNSQSTAWAVQGMVGVGRSPKKLRREGHTALGYLRSLQSGDGSIRYSRVSRQTPVWTTAQALDALAGKAFPLRAPKRRAARADGGPRTADGGSAQGGGQRAEGGGPKARAKPHAKASSMPGAAAPAPASTPPAAAAARNAAARGPDDGGARFAWWAALVGAAVAGGTVLLLRRILRRRGRLRAG